MMEIMEILEIMEIEEVPPSLVAELGKVGQFCPFSKEEI